jgi:hypothetical protein
VSAALARWRWRFWAERLGDNAPRVRALFGRYVAAVGGHITLGTAGIPAWVAFIRHRQQPGYSNRHARRAKP